MIKLYNYKRCCSTRLLGIVQGEEGLCAIRFAVVCHAYLPGLFVPSDLLGWRAAVRRVYGVHDGRAAGTPRATVMSVFSVTASTLMVVSEAASQRPFPSGESAHTHEARACSHSLTLAGMGVGPCRAVQ